MKPALLVLAAAPIAVAGVALAVARRGRAPQLQPSGRLLEIEGERIHVVDRGEGPAVVLIHGFLGNTSSWRHVVDDLSRGHRVVALDLPGFGCSERNPRADLSHSAHARRVAHLMDELGIDRATVVGHSMGGSIAQRFAIQFPERTERLVLLCAVDGSIQPDWGRSGRGARPFMAAMRGLRKWPSLTNRLTLKTLRSIVGDPDRISADDAWLYTVPLLEPGTIDCIESMLRAVREEPPVDLAAIRVPTLVLSGECDTAVPPAIGARLAAAIPGARTHVWSAIGHLPAEEDPAAFLEQLSAFIAEPAVVT